MAGTVTEGQQRQGTLNGTYQKLTAYPFVFVADAGDGSFVHAQKTDITGFLARASVKFDDNAPPNGLDLVIADSDGIDLLGGNGAGFTDSGQVMLGPPVSFINQLSIILAGNTTNLAKVTVTLYVF